MVGLILLLIFGAVAFFVQRKSLLRHSVELREEKQQGERAEEELRDAYRHLRDLGRHLLALQEEERGRIAARIHDELGQAMTAISQDVAWIEGKQPEISESIQQRYAGLQATIRSTLATVRRLSSELKPRILEESGLSEAMNWQVQQQCQRAGLESSFAAKVSHVETLLPDLALSLFRDLQELLANVVRHADAEMVVVTLMEEEGNLVLTVEDDGRGFSPASLESRTSFGFLQVRDRARYWGGTVTAGNQAEGGATVEVRVPLQRA